MRKIEMILIWILIRLPLNPMAMGLLVFLLYPVDRLTETNLTQLSVGMPVKEVVSIFGKPLTEQGYRCWCHAIDVFWRSLRFCIR